MNVDIQTERVAMRPEWHQVIDAWLQRCRTEHPDVTGVDFTLRRIDDAGRLLTEVDAVATTTGRRTVRAAERTGLMNLALRQALDALDRGLVGDDGTANVAARRGRLTLRHRRRPARAASGPSAGR